MNFQPSDLHIRYKTCTHNFISSNFLEHQMSAKGERFNRMDFLQKELFAETLSQLSAIGALLSEAANAGSLNHMKCMYM